MRVDCILSKAIKIGPGSLNDSVDLLGYLIIP